jgi:hypothetical protein
MKSTSTGSSMARMRSAMKLMAPFNTQTNKRWILSVIEGDLSAEFANTIVHFLGRHHDLTEIVLQPTWP